MHGRGRVAVAALVIGLAASAAPVASATSAFASSASASDRPARPVAVQEVASDPPRPVLSPPAAPARVQFAAHSVLVKFRRSADAPARARVAASAGARVGRLIPGTGYFVVSSEHPARRVANWLRQDARVAEVELNYRRTLASGIPSDQAYSAGAQRPLDLVRLPEAWSTTTGSSDQTVAVLDTGVVLDHPEFAGRLVPGIDLVNDDAVPDDVDGHGSMVAGVMAANANNGVGGAGITWQTKIMPVKIVQHSATTDARLAAGITWAADHGADVINMSLAGGGQSTVVQAAIAHAVAQDIVIVAAAGDSWSTSPRFPGASAGVIAVAATDAHGAIMPAANSGSWVDIAAPGAELFGPTVPWRDDYETRSGSSMAAAVVAGVAALVRAHDPLASRDDVAATLAATARDASAAGTDDSFGAGIVDAAAAVGHAPAEAIPDAYTATTIPLPPGAADASIGGFLDDGTIFATITDAAGSKTVSRWRAGVWTSLHGGVLPVAGTGESYTLTDAAADDRLVGYRQTTDVDGVATCAFIVDDLGFRCDQGRVYHAINAQGVAVGARERQGQDLPLRFSGAAAEPLPDALGGAAYDISPTGRIVGTRSFFLDGPRVSLWDPQSTVNLDWLGGGRPLVVGSDGRVGGIGGRFPTLWQGNAYAEIAVPFVNMHGGRVTGVNRAGQALATDLYWTEEVVLYRGGGVATPVSSLAPAAYRYGAHLWAHLNEPGQLAAVRHEGDSETILVLSPVAAPVPAVTDLTADRSGDETTLTWTTPTDSEGLEFVVVRRPGALAALDLAEGTVVYEGPGESAAVASSGDGHDSYSVFSRDGDGRMSGPAMVATRPAVRFVDVSMAPATATDGDQLTISGRLVMVDDGSPVAGQSVKLAALNWERGAGGDLGYPQVTDADGAVTFVTPARWHDAYQLQTTGGGFHGPALSPLGRVELTQSATTLAVEPLADSTGHGEVLDIRGRLTNTATGDGVAHAQINMTVRRSSDGLSWTSQGATDATGNINWKVLTELGSSDPDTYTLDFTFDGEPTLVPSDAGPHTVTVRSDAAVLTVSPIPATLSGATRRVTGHLRRQSNGAPLAHQEVIVRARPSGASAWERVASDRTDDDGLLDVPLQPLSNTTYQFRFAGEPGLQGDAAVRDVAVVPLLRPELTPRLVRQGAEALLAGAMSPAEAGHTVLLQRRAGDRWVDVADAVTNRRGDYATRFEVRHSDLREYRVAVAKAPAFLARRQAAGSLRGYAVSIVGLDPDGGTAHSDGSGEWIDLRNRGTAPIGLGGWQLRSEDWSPYLPQFRLEAGTTVRVFTGPGNDRPGRIYLDFRHQLWPRGGGTAVLLDRAGNKADSFSYGR